MVMVLAFVASEVLDIVTWLRLRRRFQLAHALLLDKTVHLKARPQHLLISKGTRVLISLWHSLMFGRVPKNAAPFLGIRPNISEYHSEISTRAPFCIQSGH